MAPLNGNSSEDLKSERKRRKLKVDQDLGGAGSSS